MLKENNHHAELLPTRGQSSSRSSEWTIRPYAYCSAAMHSKSSRRPTPARPRPIASGARLARLRTSLRPRPDPPRRDYPHSKGAFDMSISTCLITGASNGLGYALAEHMSLKQGDQVVL